MTSPEVNVADTANLLSRSTEESEDDPSRPGCCRRRRRSGWFAVEPVLIAYCFNQFPMMIITQKYALDWISVNVFNASSGGSWPPAASIPSPCDPNTTELERQLSEKVQSLASLFSVVEAVVFGVPALIVAVILGAGSDRFGRRQLSETDNCNYNRN